MFKRLPFPWAHVLELLLAVPLLVSFYAVVAFLASKPAQALRASGAVIPANWEAAVPSHGSYLRGLLPSAHPVLLGTAVAALVTFAVIAWQLRLAQAAQQRLAAPEHSRRHQVAAAATIAAWAVLAWLLITVALPRVAAA